MAEAAAAEKPTEEVKVSNSDQIMFVKSSDAAHIPCMCLQPTPVFGQAFATGTGGGFGAFTGVSNASASDAGAAAAADGEDEDGTAPEEECQAEYKPVVQLEEVETSTGEEDEEALTEL